MNHNRIATALGKLAKEMACAAAAAALTASVAFAAGNAAGVGNYPNHYIQFIIPFAPGGGVDLFGRTVAQLLNDQKLVTQNIQVVNKPGAGGSIGIAQMVEHKGDPYLLLGIAIHAIATPLTLGTPYNYKDMTPIAKLFSEYEMLVARTESPFKNLMDVAAALRKDPGSVSIGGASLGNADHITVATFAKVLGVDPTRLNYIPYSGGESNNAILGGHVDLGMGGLDLITQVEAGRMRVLAISAPKRLGGRFKDFQTFREQGYDVVNENWRGIFAPPGISPAVVQYWRNALAKMVESPAWKKVLEQNQWVNTFETDSFRASLDRDNQLYSTLLGQLGLLKSQQKR